MTMRRLLALIILFVAASSLAQTTTVPASGTARRLVRAAALPATCSVSDVYFKTAATVGPNVCLTANNWTAITIGGITEAAADLRYLKLAADNDPLTGTLTLATTGLVFPGSTSGTTSLVATAIAGTTALILPAASDTLVGKATTDVLTNKSIAFGTNTVTGTIAEFNTSVTDADFATLAGAETLAGPKTLSTPTIAGNFTLDGASDFTVDTS